MNCPQCHSHDTMEIMGEWYCVPCDRFFDENYPGYGLIMEGLARPDVSMFAWHEAVVGDGFYSGPNWAASLIEAWVPNSYGYKVNLNTMKEHWPIMAA